MSPAAIAASSAPGGTAFAASASTRRGNCGCPFGYVGGVQCDPVEKKPFFHVYPGTDALTFGMLGCDFHCSYCQNWVTSQALRDEAALAPIQPVTPEQLMARRSGAARAAGRLQLQRAAHHRGMGRRRLPAGQGSRAGLRLRLQRQRHARGAGFPAPLDRRLQD